MGKTGYSMALPVLSARPSPDGTLAVVGEVNGTCCSIGGPFFLTAGHVVASAPAEKGGRLVVGIQGPDGHFKAAEVLEGEQLPGDLGILKVSFRLYPESETWLTKIPWSERPLEPFEIVRTIGYPYGMHLVGNEQSIVIRAFQGHVVASLLKFKPAGISGPPFGVYELSFMAPRGLSGALLMNSNGLAAAHGVVIGNSESRMLVFRSVETESQGQHSSSYEQYEALSLGIAVTAQEVLSRRSRLLSGTIREYLAAQGLLRP